MSAITDIPADSDASSFRAFLRSAGKLALARQVSGLIFVGAVLVLPALTTHSISTDFVWTYFAMMTITSLLGFGLERLAGTVTRGTRRPGARQLPGAGAGRSIVHPAAGSRVLVGHAAIRRRRRSSRCVVGDLPLDRRGSVRAARVRGVAHGRQLDRGARRHGVGPGAPVGRARRTGARRCGRLAARRGDRDARDARSSVRVPCRSARSSSAARRASGPCLSDGARRSPESRWSVC